MAKVEKYDMCTHQFNNLFSQRGQIVIETRLTPGQ